VRGLCYFGFQAGTELGSITFDDVLRLRACPNITYAIAYWIFNSHRAEWDARNRVFWIGNPYIRALVSDDEELFMKIYEILVDMECDENDDDEDETSSDDEPVQAISNNMDLSGDPV
jgi:hypothetical protein